MPATTVLNAYDYIIVGAGSAGCVLANRLSARRTCRVLLLEAGGRDRNPFLHLPAGWAVNVGNPQVDWCYHTAPEPHLHHRSITWPRGKVLGGSSAINGMVYVRGVPQDFDAWAQAGCPGWSFDDVLPYFRRAEDQCRGADTFHGSGGPLHVAEVRDQRPVHHTFIDAMTQAGIPRNPDFNGVRQAGCGFYQFTQKHGRRWSSASAYLRPARQRPNLNVLTGAHVQRVQFAGRHASGVRFQRGSVSMEAHARRRVILCGGTVNSPQLLELSGVGDGERLAALGIHLVHALPGVGENLQDHLYSKVVWGCRPEHSMNAEVRGLRLAGSALNWLLRRQGPLTTGSAPVGGFWYSRADAGRSAAPDLQIHFASGATLYNDNGRLRALDVPAITGIVNQSRPQSRGSIHITSRDATLPPAIVGNYLEAAADRSTLLAGVRLLLRIFAADALQPLLTERLSPGSELDSGDDDALLEHIRADASTTFHPVGTCRMGSDRLAVVDPQLNVRGLTGLSVADASVMPLVPSGNTNAAAIMIGERAADLIRQQDDDG